MEDDGNTGLIFSGLAKEALLQTPVEIFIEKGRFFRKHAVVKAGGMWLGKVSAFRRKTLLDNCQSIVSAYYNTLNGI